MSRVLLGQLGSNGDCLYATTVARQIRHDFPDCELTWAISSLCRNVIKNNPDVDHVWEVDTAGWGDIFNAWRRFAQEIPRHKFDRVFLTQINPDGFGNYDGTIRPSLFRNYGSPITVPVETVISLTEHEKERVDGWASRHRISSFGKVVLFECSSKSGQSFVTPAIAAEIASRLVTELPDIVVILSTIEPVAVDHPRIIPGGELSLRETAALTAYASLFVGCGSGVTVVATSNAAKPNLPMIQILSPEMSVYASFKHDFLHFNKNADHILETTSPSLSRLTKTITVALRDGIATAERMYGKKVRLDFNAYCSKIDGALLSKGQYFDAARSVTTTVERYGPHPQLVRFGRSLIAPFLPLREKVKFEDAILGKISLQ